MNIMLIFSILFCAVNLQAGNYKYRQAAPEDLPALLSLINTHGAAESKRIVILPKRFREQNLRDAINKGRIFVATSTKADEEGKTDVPEKSAPCKPAAPQIVAYKKLFVVESTEEKAGIVQNELRCTAENCTLSGRVQKDQFQKQHLVFPKDLGHCIYNGADFTHPDHRKKGINNVLTTFALASVLDKTKSAKTPRITLLYGLTTENAGKTAYDAIDRSRSLAKLFSEFVSNVYGISKDTVTSDHFRFTAFMPTFDPEAQKLQPLPDAKSIPGYGCVLTYSQEKQK